MTKPGRNIRRSHKVPIAVFFASSPDEELSAMDMAAKFDIPDVKNVYQAVRALERDGWIAPSGSTRPRLYKAGPATLAMIGRPAP